MKPPGGWTRWHPKHEKTFGSVAVPTYALRAHEEVPWFWIGPHADYDSLVAR